MRWAKGAHDGQKMRKKGKVERVPRDPGVYIKAVDMKQGAISHRESKRRKGQSR